MRCVRFKTNLGIARVRYCVHMSGFSVRHRGWGWVVVVEGSSCGGGRGRGNCSVGVLCVRYRVLWLVMTKRLDVTPC